MKARTQEFKDKIKMLGRELDSIITYELDGEQIELRNEQLNSVTPNYKGAILKSVMKQLDIETTAEIPLNTVINYQFGVKIRNDEVEDYKDNYDYINFGNFVVYSVEKQEDTNSYKIICYDKMLYSMKDYESVGVTYPTTIRNYINAICTHLGLTFANASDTFANYDKVISNELYLDINGNSLGYTFRDVFDELAQVTASTICINNNDELEIRYIVETNDSVDKNFLKDVNVNFGEKYGPINSIVLSRSAESDNVYLKDDESVEENGLCEIKIVDNQIMNFNDRSTYLPDILEKLDGLEYYLNDFTSTGICYYDLCDKYKIIIDENEYNCVMFNDEIIVTQGLEENIYTEMPEESETDYTKADKTDRQINQVYIIVNKQNQTIQALIDRTDETETTVSELDIEVDEIRASISSIADTTTTAEGTGLVNLQNVLRSELLYLRVYPTSVDIKALYPENTLYPSNDLYPKTHGQVVFTNSDETITIDIPSDLLILNDVKDELIIDYASQTMYKIKRIGINANCEKYELATPEIIYYTYPSIVLEGDYEIYVPMYNGVYIYARALKKNEYTSQMVTNIELNSAITLSQNNIMQQVNGIFNMIDGEIREVNATLELKIDPENLISEINASADIINLTGNRIIIDSDNFKVTENGTITATNGVFKGTFTAYNTYRPSEKAVEISNNQITLYSLMNGNECGSLFGSSYMGDRLYTAMYLTSEDDIYLISGGTTCFSYNSSYSAIGYPPYLVNTASGTLFSNNPNGGITIDNGLITSWNIQTESSTILITDGNGGTWEIEILDGLIISTNHTN